MIAVCLAFPLPGTLPDQISLGMPGLCMYCIVLYPFVENWELPALPLLVHFSLVKSISCWINHLADFPEVSEIRSSLVEHGAGALGS